MPNQQGSFQALWHRWQPSSQGREAQEREGRLREVEQGPHALHSPPQAVTVNPPARTPKRR